jgi:two-component system nitrate/nitrite response regulator NarL
MATGTKQIRIVIADDHPLLREGLKAVLASDPRMQVVGEAEDGDDAVRLVDSLRPDVLLLDMSMPRQTGLDTLRALAAKSRPARVIVLTASIDRAELVEAIHLGARGVVMKQSGVPQLAIAIRGVMAGELWVGRDVIGDLRQHPPPPAPEARAPKTRLTKRERQVVGKVMGGCTNRDIARELGITEDTAKRHLTHIFDKLGVSNRLELALYAVNNPAVAEG